MMAAMGLAASLPGIDAQTYRGLEPGASQSAATPPGDQARAAAKTVAKAKSAPAMDPAEAAMLRSRSARTVLRNGLDYIKYQQYEKALAYLREAEKRTSELNPQELISLRQGIEAAQDGLRSPTAQVGYARSRKPQSGSIAIAGRRGTLPPVDSQMVTASAEKSTPKISAAEIHASDPAQVPADLKQETVVAKLDPISPEVLSTKLPSAAELANSRTIDSARRRYDAASQSNSSVPPIQEPKGIVEPAPTQKSPVEKSSASELPVVAENSGSPVPTKKTSPPDSDDIPPPLPDSPAAVSSATKPAGLPPLEEPAPAMPVKSAEPVAVKQDPAAELPISSDDLKAPEVAVPPLPVVEEIPAPSAKPVADNQPWAQPDKLLVKPTEPAKTTEPAKPTDLAKPSEAAKTAQPALEVEAPAQLPELPAANTLPEARLMPVIETVKPAEVKVSVEVEKPVKVAVEEAKTPERLKLPELPVAEKLAEAELPALPELPAAEPQASVQKSDSPANSKSDDKTVTVSSEKTELAKPVQPDEKSVSGVPVLTPLPDDDSAEAPSLPPLPTKPASPAPDVSSLPPLSVEDIPATANVKAELPADPVLPVLPSAKPVDEAMPPLPTAKPLDEAMPPLPTAKPVDEAMPPLPEKPLSTNDATKAEVKENATLPALPVRDVETAASDTPPLPTQVKEEEPVKIARKESETTVPATGELPPLPAEEVTGSAGVAAAVTTDDSNSEKAANRLLSGLSPERRRAIEEIARAQVERPGGATPGLSPLGGGSSSSSMPQINNRGMLPGGGNMSALDDPLVRLELPRAPSPAEARPIRAILLPEQFDNIKPREFDPRRKMWASSAVAHYPLYFQDPSLERYGISIEQRMGRGGRKLTYPIDDPTQSKLRNQIATPFFSAGLFALQTATWPLRMVADPPWEAEYDLGYYRPGDRVPEDTVVVPWKGVGPLFKGNKY